MNRREYAKGKHNIKITNTESENGIEMNVEILKTCGRCLWLCKEDGEPFYCLRKDLYTFREEDDLGCEDWQEC